MCSFVDIRSIRTVAVAFVCLFVIGCGGKKGFSGQTTPHVPQPDENRLAPGQIHEILSGATFTSEEEQEGGLGPDGIVYGYWRLTFREKGFSWQFSDVVTFVEYQVTRDGRLLASYEGETTEMPYDGKLDRVQWKGVWYNRVKAGD